MPRLFFLAFADSRYGSQKRIRREADSMNVFDDITVGDERILETWFRKKYKHLLHGRGYGYWIWKPYLVRRTMDRMDEWDFLVYADAGCTLNPKGIKRLHEYCEMAQKCPAGIVAFDQHWREAEWTKSDLFEYLGVLGNPDYMEHGQVATTCFIIQKKPLSQQFIDTWYYIHTSHHSLTTDEPSRLPNDPNFQEHRHDQSVFSLLSVKYGIATLPVEEIFTEGDWEKLKDYPIWATRKRMKKRTWDKEIKYRIKKMLFLTK